MSCSGDTAKTVLTCSATKTTLPIEDNGAQKNYTVTIADCKLYTGIVLSVSSGTFFNFSACLLAIVALVFL